VLASCETVKDVRAARKRGYATAITLEKFPGRRAFLLNSKEKVIPCPAQTTEGVTCSSCRLCMDAERLHEQRLTIGFAIHGTPLLRRRATLALREPNNPDRKLSTRVLIPRAEAELQEKLGRRPTNKEIADVIGVTEASVWEMRKAIETGQPTRPWGVKRKGKGR
jgi:hypothetical protein